MENLKEKDEFLYREPIKGDVQKFLVTFHSDKGISVSNTISHEDFTVSNKVYPDGSYYLEGVGSFFPETEEWKRKYQDSLYLRVSQIQFTVYFVQAVKRGKVNTRALVVNDEGVCYHTFVPTFPSPRFGQSYEKLFMDLEVVSVIPIKDLLKKVGLARMSDLTL